MSDSTRRGFLKYAGVGAVAAGAATVVPLASADAKPEKVALPKAAKGSIVAYVHDVHSGEMSLMVEGHEVTVKDPELVARIATALHANSPHSVNNAAL